MHSGWLKIVNVTQLIMDASIGTICFILGTALGVIVLGAAPSLSALMWAMDERIKRDSARAMWPMFWRRFFTDFWGANRELLAPLLIVGFLIYDYALVSVNTSESLRWLSQIGIGALVCVFTLATVQLIVARNSGEFTGYLVAVRRVLTRPVQNLLIATVTFLLFRLSAAITGFAILLVWGLWAAAISSITQALDKGKSPR